MAGLMAPDPLPGVQKDPALGANVFTAGSTGIDPTLRTVDPTKETVQGQITGLMSKENPLMTQARTNAAQTANARGLLNSSMAAGAGEQAVINTALPIASQDASTYGTAARDNQATTNTALQFNAGAKNTVALANANSANQSGLLKQQGEQAVTMQGLQATSAKELANIEAQYKTTMQTSASAVQIMSTAQQGINAILADTTLSNDAKAALITQLQSGLKAQMGVVGAISNIDLSSLLVFPTVSTAPPPATPGKPANPARTPFKPTTPAGYYYPPSSR